MKVLNINAGKSINPNTGESWYKADIHVSVDDSENPEDVFQSLKARLDSWLPNPFETKVSTPITITKEQIVTAHIQTLNECKTLRNLEMFKSMVDREKEDSITEAYNNKKKELQNPQL